MGRSGPRATTGGDFTGQQTRRPLSFNLFGRVRTCCRWIQAPSRRCTPSATLPDFANVPTERLLFCGVGGSGMTPLALIIQARSGRVEGSDRALDEGRNAERFNFLRTRGVLLHPQDGSGMQAAHRIGAAVTTRARRGPSPPQQRTSLRSDWPA